MLKSRSSSVKLPCSILEISKSSFTRRDKRLVSSSTMVKYWFCFSGGMVPSKMPCTKPPMVVIGVRKSCDTLATKLRRMVSSCSIESAILLNESPSSPSSVVSFK